MHVCTDTEDWGWGSLVATRKLGSTPSRSEAPLIGKNEPSPLIAVNQNYVLDILLGVAVNEQGICPYSKDDGSQGINHCPQFPLISLILCYFITFCYDFVEILDRILEFTLCVFSVDSVRLSTIR